MGESDPTAQACDGAADSEPTQVVQTRTVTVDDLTSWISNGSPFALSRWGNGEWHSVFGRSSGQNKSGQEYVPELGEQLRKLLRHRPPYMMELKKWENIFGNGVSSWLIDEHLDDLDWLAPDILHKASMKGRLSPVIQALQNAPEFLAIGPSHLRAAQGTLGFGTLVEVPPVNAFSALNELREQAFAAAAALPRGAVITVSASMAANLLIDELYGRFGHDLILLDVGSLWDPYAGVKSRSYMNDLTVDGILEPLDRTDSQVDPAPNTPVLKPIMSSREIELLKYTAEGKKCAVEFGIGGSTLCLIDAGVERLISIESDPVWIQKVSQHPRVLPHVASGRLTLHHGDIGPTRKWGHPEDGSQREKWSNYWRAPWTLVDGSNVDLVFIDGRFRVACALNALAPGNRDVTIAIHDFWNRPKYAVLLQYLNCASRADTLGVFFPKANIDTASLARDLMLYAERSA